MRILSPIVLSQALFTAGRQPEISDFAASVRAQLVDPTAHSARRPCLFKQLAHISFTGCTHSLVRAVVYTATADLAFLIEPRAAAKLLHPRSFTAILRQIPTQNMAVTSQPQQPGASQGSRTSVPITHTFSAETSSFTTSASRFFNITIAHVNGDRSPGQTACWCSHRPGGLVAGRQRSSCAIFQP